jgi:hypothetical protein
MMRVALVTFALLPALAAATSSAPALAQEAPTQSPAPAAPETTGTPEAPKAEKPGAQKRGAPPTLLRVEVVLSRYQGDKKMSSVPYGFLVTDDREWVKVRMGVEVPVPITMFTPGDPSSNRPATSFQYRNVGTNIDCSAKPAGAWGNPPYQVNLKVENSSVVTTGEGRPASGTEFRVANAPVFRTFNVSLSPVLRDGQSIQTVASTDPVTGEVVKIDVTLNVVK